MVKTCGTYSPIGIDIGNARVKMLQLVNRKGQIRVHQKCHFPIPQGTFLDGRLAETSILLKKLKAAKQNQNWHGKQAVICLENRATFMSLVNLPLLSARELEQALQLEAENRFPLAGREAVFSYIPTGGSADNGSISRQYLLAATSKETADNYCHLALGAGFNPLALETAPPALHRSAMQDYFAEAQGPANLSITINIGYSSTVVLVSSGDAYLFHRIINRGIVSFLQAHSAPCPDKAPPSLNHIFAPGSLAEKNLLEPAARLARAFKETITYYLENYAAAAAQKPDTITLSGGCTFIPGLGRYLQNSMGCKLSPHNPLQDLGINGKQRNSNNHNYEGLLFPVAHGLALRGWLK
jgi:type IV pilus assembly protein PilM